MTTPPGCTTEVPIKDRVYLFDEGIVVRIVDQMIERVGKVEAVRTADGRRPCSGQVPVS